LILDFRFWILGWIVDLGFGIWESARIGLGLRQSKTQIQSEIQNQIQNPIQNPKSKI
jgi:hypothetical protein